MSATQTASVDTDPPKSLRLFRLYDPEVVAVVAILLGLLQMLLSVTTYNMRPDVRLLFCCPLSVGFASLVAGSLSMASERIPSRQMLRKSMLAGLASLVMAVIALCIYGYSVSNYPGPLNCTNSNPEQEHEHEHDHEHEYFYGVCPALLFQRLYNGMSGLLIFYVVGAMAVHSFLSYSAFRGLRTN